MSCTRMMAQTGSLSPATTVGTWSDSGIWTSGVVPDASTTVRISTPFNIDLELDNRIEVVGVLIGTPSSGDNVVTFRAASSVVNAELKAPFINVKGANVLILEDSVSLDASNLSLNSDGSSGWIEVQGSINGFSSGPNNKALTISGGVVALGGRNTYEDATELKGGVLILRSSEALGVPSSTVIISGGVLTASATTASATITVPNNVSVRGNFELGAGGSDFIKLAGAVDLNNGARRITVGEVAEISGSISDGTGVGPGKLTKDGYGDLVLSSPNTYSGGTEVVLGTLRVTADQALGLSPNGVAGPVSVSGGVLDVTTTTQIVSGLVIGGSIVADATSRGVVIVSGSHPEILVNVNSSAEVGAVLGEDGFRVDGQVSLRKKGGGAVYLTAPNRYSGGTVLEQGSIIVADNEALGFGPVTLRGGVLASDRPQGRTLLNSIRVTGGAQLGVDDTSITVADTLIEAGASLNLKGQVEMTMPMSLRGTLVLSSADLVNKVKVADLNVSPNAVIIWDKAKGTPGIQLTAPAGPVNLAGVKVGVTSEAIQASGPLRKGDLFATVLTTPNGIVSLPQAQNGGGIISFHVDPNSGPNDVNLIVDRRPYREFVRPAGDPTFGDALEKLRSNPAYDSVLDRLDSLATRSEIESAIRALDGGLAFANLSALSTRHSLVVGGVLDDHLDELTLRDRPGTALSMGVKQVLRPTQAPSSNRAVVIGGSNPWTYWNAGYGSWTHLNEHGGFGSASSKEGGAAMGLERQVGNAVGGLIVIAGEQISLASDPELRVRSDYFNFGAYSSVAIGQFTVDASGLWGIGENESRRPVAGATATADYRSHDWQAGVGATVNLAPEQSQWRVAPVARLKFAHSNADHFEEHGSLLPIGSSGFNNDRLLSNLGFGISRAGRIAARIDLGVDAGAYWVHDFASKGREQSFQIAGINYQTRGRSSDADFAQLKLGVHTTFSDTWAIRLSGQRDIGNQWTQTSGIFSVGVHF